AVFAILTQHGKEQVIGPAVEQDLGGRLEVVTGFDTDTLGTFTRDVPRAGTQLEAARRKAQIAIDRSGRLFGLGSEGAFVPRAFGLGSWNIEMVVLVDAEQGIEVCGRAMAEGLHVYRSVSTRAQLEKVAMYARFPEHGLVVRPEEANDPRIWKGLRDWTALEAAFDSALRQSAKGEVFVESDLRAHMHPSRMAVIGLAARDLAERLRTPCPACGVVGFGLRGKMPGLPCAACGAPTQEPLADEHGCVACEHREERPLQAGTDVADPSLCQYCNP
ncbi:MAG: hypothetical protein RIS45_1018, partial [Planctomycetota bacterium]